METLFTLFIVASVALLLYALTRSDLVGTRSDIVGAERDNAVSETPLSGRRPRLKQRCLRLVPDLMGLQGLQK